MLRVRVIAGLALSGAILAGCNKHEGKQADASGASSTPAQATPAAGSSSPQAPGSPTAPATATVGAGVVHPLALPSLPPDTAPLTTTTPSGDQTAEARKLLTAIAVNTADRKWDAAEANFKKLDAMQLSSQMKDAATKAHEQFVAARTASRITLPGLGGPATSPTDVEQNK